MASRDHPTNQGRDLEQATHSSPVPQFPQLYNGGSNACLLQLLGEGSDTSG